MRGRRPVISDIPASPLFDHSYDRSGSRCGRSGRFSLSVFLEAVMTSGVRWLSLALFVALVTGCDAEPLGVTPAGWPGALAEFQSLAASFTYAATNVPFAAADNNRANE